MFKVNNKDTRKTPCRSGVYIYIVNFEHISHLHLVFLLLTLNMLLLVANGDVITAPTEYQMRQALFLSRKMKII